MLFRSKVKGKYTGKVKWSSSKKKIATVSSKGVVTAKKKGTAKVTAKVGKKKLFCNLTVKKRVEIVLPAVNPTATPLLATQTPQVTSPVIQPTEVPTMEPTQTPEPTATPAYMSEGAFVYEKLDISWINPEKPMIAFTFDDGPIGTKDTDASMRILNALKEYGMHATFNYITGLINSNTEGEILRALDDGHEIGNHTTGYSSLTSYDAEGIAADVEKARQALENLTGITSFTLRPPNLALNNDVYHNVNVPLIGCNVYSLDWEGKTTQQIIANVENAKDGDIVLMHENYTTTAEAVEYLVPYFVEKGFQIVSVAELYAVKDIPLYPGKYYNCTTKAPTEPTE